MLARDEQAVAGMYAVPSLILCPGNAVAVSDRGQTEQFFASSWDQYDGVDDVRQEVEVEVVAEAPGSTWADVTWIHGGEPRERFCYQLVPGADGLRIAVLTPLPLPGQAR
ncbi:hypothetical protein [Geodermatophilus sp. SYSU D00815]